MLTHTVIFLNSFQALVRNLDMWHQAALIKRASGISVPYSQAVIPIKDSVHADTVT